MNIFGVLFGLLVAGLLVCLIAIMWKRKVHRDFPWFFAYLISVVLATLIEDAVYRKPGPYFYTYWSCDAVSLTLALFALHEVFRRVFLAFYKVWPGFKIIFPATTLLIVLLASWNEVSHPPIHVPQIIVVILSVGKVVRYLQAGVFALFFLLVWILGLDWEEYPFGIVLGFTISAIGSWIGYDVRLEYGTRFLTFAQNVGPATYLAAVLVWLAAFRRPQAATKQWLGITPEQMLVQAKQYLAALRGK